jgi:exodeoxyribonuclease VIII
VTYDEIKAINWSSLKHLAISPLLYRWRLEHPEPRKPAFIFGGAVHCAILEPEKFDERYAVFDGIRRGKAWEDWLAIHPGVESLKPDELDAIRSIAAAVLGHRVAAGLLRGGRREEAVTWTDEETGLACKGRLDYLRPDFVIDLKTTRDPAPSRFERASASYGYAGQVAFYHDGAARQRLIPGDVPPYLIAPQTSEPYDVAVFQLAPETLEAGRRQYRTLLRRLALCIEADYWPGVAPDLVPLSLPPWAEGQGSATEESEDF